MIALEIIGYVIIGILVFVLSPILNRLTGWGKFSDEESFYFMAGLFWPLFFAGFLGWWLFKYPVIGVVFLREVIGSYYTDSAIHERKQKKLKAKQEKKNKKKVRVSEESESARKNFEEQVLAYREANCSGCGRSLDNCA